MVDLVYNKKLIILYKNYIMNYAEQQLKLYNSIGLLDKNVDVVQLMVLMSEFTNEEIDKFLTHALLFAYNDSKGKHVYITMKHFKKAYYDNITDEYDSLRITTTTSD